MRTTTATPDSADGGGFRDLDLRIAYQTADDPLNNFYVPVLSEATRLDRTTGYFSSWALVIAATGIAHLIRNGGTMRLLVGAQLRHDDVDAITAEGGLPDRAVERLLELLEQPEDELAQRRLEALAWMVAAGTLQMKVVLPRGPDGRPLAGPVADAYFHAKYGVFTNTPGDRIGFTGSLNETEHGWRINYEEFHVFRSWVEGERPHVTMVERFFDEAWTGRHPDWISLPIPEAVRLRLLEWAPSAPPPVDPLEEGEPPQAKAVADGDERVIAAFIRDVPMLARGGVEAGIASSAIVPWPHQVRVARRAVATYPERYLLADEVGLGKTIEAGLVLRDLLISHNVERCLILSPASVMKQWQSELKEKFALQVPILDGGRLIGPEPDRIETSVPPGNPWTAAPAFIASSQLAKRKDRRGDLLRAGPWDLLIVDEAHHARRKDFLDLSQRRPNRLLELLEGFDDLPGLAQQTNGLLLLTATPMQVHAIEVWDLLQQLGMAGRWGASESSFLRYFDELRIASTDAHRADWAFLATMARDELKHGGDVTDEVSRAFEDRVGFASWYRLKDFPLAANPRAEALDMAEAERTVLLDLLRYLTPLRRRMFRHTRNLLRRYEEHGLLPGKIAERDPDPRWIRFTEDEDALYRRIDDYIANFYRKYEHERKGLGFVMTVYRRRLTSSFHALARSLERRLAWLQQASPDIGLTDEDLEDADLDDDISEELAIEGQTATLPSLFREEAEYVEQFLADLGKLGTDSKFDRLVQDLDRALATRDSVVIFTQYTDTMDYLRERLRIVYGTRIACYSGRGGEWWSGVAWAPITKEEVKRAFKAGEVQILLGTDALAEGLNLQTCGVEINYDVPWNPMRLEQRIGRIDRIGQVHDRVWIWNYFSEDTVEAEVYRRLLMRIDWFRGVVGPLQPILHRVERAIREVALTGREERDLRLDAELREIEQEMDRAEREGLRLDELIDVVVPPSAEPPPASPEELEAFLVGSSIHRYRFREDNERVGAYLLRWEGLDVAVTFHREVADAHPDSVRFITIGEPVCEALLKAFPEPNPGERVVRAVAEIVGRELVGWFGPGTAGAREIATLADLRTALIASLGMESGRWVDDAIERFGAEMADRIEDERRSSIRRADERLSALQERGRLLLARGTHIWVAQKATDGGGTPSVTETIVNAMIATQGYPWGPLSTRVPGLAAVSSGDHEWLNLAKRSSKQLDGLWSAVRVEADRVLRQILAAEQALAGAEATQPSPLVSIESY